MKREFLLLILNLIFFVLVSAQDTTYLYFNRYGDKCDKDTAAYYARIFKDGNLWIRQDFRVTGHIRKMEGTYLEQSCKTRQGLFKFYDDNGILDYSREYDNGAISNSTLYYENASKKKFIKYDEENHNSKSRIKSGRTMPSKLEVEANFPGGPRAWDAYLATNTDFKVAAIAKAPPGIYKVRVEFVVNREGKMHDVKAMSVPKECKPCGLEAVRVIKASPNWQPAVLNGETIFYRGVQFIKFEVEKE